MKCPGQDTQYWQPDSIYEEPCPRCSALVEFYKDDSSRKCLQCGHRFVNPRLDFGCAAYCQYAEHCIGSLSETTGEIHADLMREKILVALQKKIGSSNTFQYLFVRIKFFAELLAKQRTEEQQQEHATGLVVAGACLLFCCKIFGRKAAEAIMAEQCADQTLLLWFSAMIQNSSSHAEGKTSEEKIIADALLLVELEEQILSGKREKKFSIDLRQWHFFTQQAADEAATLLQQKK